MVLLLGCVLLNPFGHCFNEIVPDCEVSIRVFRRGIEMNEERIEALEVEFKKRYNREVEIRRDVFTANKKFTKVIVEFRHDKKCYVLTEHFTDDQLTDYVTLEHNDKCHRYSRYLDAEVHMADLIGG